MKKVILALMLAIVCLVITGCQTMEGLGGDVRWTGEQIEAGASNFTK